jgi:sec-independent protein translocase protein TatB
MFDFDAGKLLIIGIVALIVIGPKELPRVMRQAGRAAAKMQRMAAEFRAQFMDAMREAEIADIKAGVEKLAESTKLDAGVDPLAEIRAGITSALEASGKPATLPVESVEAIAAPGDPQSALNSIALPGLPEAPQSGTGTFVGEGVAPLVPEPETETVPASKAPPAATEAEMQAIADALAAEMGTAQPQAAGAEAVKTQDSAAPLVRPSGFGYIKNMFRKS